MLVAAIRGKLAAPTCSVTGRLLLPRLSHVLQHDGAGFAIWLQANLAHICVKLLC